MSHLDDDMLAGVALGDELAPDGARHLDECADCAARVRDFRELAARSARLTRPEALMTPPARVWEAIAAEVASDPRPLALGDPGTPDVADGDDPATVVPIRRRFSGWLVAAAAAVGLVVGGVGVGLWVSDGAGPSTVVASADLTDLATEQVAGSAHVEDRPDGTRVLVVDTTFAPQQDADLEVWLIDPNIEGMVSLGFLTSGRAEFAIPAGYDPGAYPIVDISVEPRDGVPTHSGDSITRGTLGA